MAFVTNHIQIDGSLNVDGSIFQYNLPFVGGGGGGGGDVAWASGSVGSNNQVITAAGDGSIVAEANLLFDDSNGVRLRGGKDFNLIAPTDSSDAGDIVWKYDDGAGEWARLWSSPPSGNLYYRSEPDGLAARLVYHDGNLFNSGNTDNNLVTASGGAGLVGESTLTFNAGELVINGSLNALIRSEFNNINTENTSRSDIEISAINKSIYFGVDPCITGFDTVTSYIDNRTGGPFGIMTDGNEQLIVDPDGNVGINTTPSYRLDVDGSIRATEGFITGNFEIVHNTTSDSLDFNYIG